MAKVPVPDRGQPLDVDYIYLLAEAINTLSNDITSATNKYTTVSSDGGTHNVRTGDARIVAGSVTINSAQSVSANSSVQFRYDLGGGFKYTPVVTATPVNTGSQGSQVDVTVIIDSVTTQSVSGQAYFRTSGNLSVDVNIVAVGIPE